MESYMNDEEKMQFSRDMREKEQSTAQSEPSAEARDEALCKRASDLADRFMEDSRLDGASLRVLIGAFALGEVQAERRRDRGGQTVSAEPDPSAEAVAEEWARARGATHQWVEDIKESLAPVLEAYAARRVREAVERERATCARMAEDAARGLRKLQSGTADCVANDLEAIATQIRARSTKP